MLRITRSYNKQTLYIVSGDKLSDYGKVIPSTRLIIAEATALTKEEYLQWLADWKSTIRALETIIKRVKAARKPAEIPSNKLFTEMFDSWGIPMKERELFAAMTTERKLEWFFCVRSSALTEMKKAATELYRVRRNMKLAAAMSRQLSK